MSLKSNTDHQSIVTCDNVEGRCDRNACAQCIVPKVCGAIAFVAGVVVTAVFTHFTPIWLAPTPRTLAVVGDPCSGRNIVEKGNGQYPFTAPGETSFDIQSPQVVEFALLGAAGGGSKGEGTSSGGPGSFLIGRVQVNRGSTLKIVVGKGGELQKEGQSSNAYPDGGAGGLRIGRRHGGGGGSTRLYLDGDLIAVAGAGGGAGSRGCSAFGTSNTPAHGGPGDGNSRGSCAHESVYPNGVTMFLGATSEKPGLNGGYNRGGNVTANDSSGGGGGGGFNGGGVFKLHAGGGGGSSFVDRFRAFAQIYVVDDGETYEPVGGVIKPRPEAYEHGSHRGIANPFESSGEGRDAATGTDGAALLVTNIC